MLAVPPILPFRAAPGATPPGITVRKLAKRYLADRAADARAGSITKAHHQRLRFHLRSLIRKRCWGGMEVKDFRPQTARRWLRSHKGWRSPHQLEAAYRSLRALFEWGVNEELLDRSPVRALKKWWPPPQPRGACLPDDFAALMAAARNAPRSRRKPSSLRFRVQMWTLWHTGARTCEMRAACWEHLDLERGLLVLPKGKTTRATGKPRIIPLPDRVLRVLAWLTRRGRPEAGPIFTATGGKPLQRRSWNRLFQSYAKRAKLRPKVTTYTLRHGFCVCAIQAGLTDAEIATIMGHANTSQIQWYGRDLQQQTDHTRARSGQVHAAKPTAAKPTSRRKADRPDQPSFDWGE